MFLLIFSASGSETRTTITMLCEDLNRHPGQGLVTCLVTSSPVLIHH